MLKDSTGRVKKNQGKVLVLSLQLCIGLPLSVLWDTGNPGHWLIDWTHLLGFFKMAYLDIQLFFMF